MAKWNEEITSGEWGRNLYEVDLVYLKMLLWKFHRLSRADRLEILDFRYFWLLFYGREGITQHFGWEKCVGKLPFEDQERRITLRCILGNRFQEQKVDEIGSLCRVRLILFIEYGVTAWSISECNALCQWAAPALPKGLSACKRLRKLTFRALTSRIYIQFLSLFDTSTYLFQKVVYLLQRRKHLHL